MYNLILIQRSFQGPPHLSGELDDYNRRELSTMLVMIAMLIWLGVYPQPVLEVSLPTVESLLGALNR